MIKVDTSRVDNNGNIVIEIADSPIKLATEALTIVACLKAAIKDRGNDYKDKYGEVDSMMFEMLFLTGLKHVLENDIKATGHPADMRAADFDSTEDFLNWLHGVDEN